MADAQNVIRNMAMQVAQLATDKAVLQAELDEVRAKYSQTADFEVVTDEEPKA